MSRRRIKDFLNTIIVGDAEIVLGEMPDDCVDMVITSPPYNFGRPYEGSSFKDNLRWDEYFDKLYRVWKECYRVLKPSGRIAVVVQPHYSHYIPTHHIISRQMWEIGFLWITEIIWQKNHYAAKVTSWGSWKSPAQPYLKHTHEFIEVFGKGSRKKVGCQEAEDITANEFKEWVKNSVWVIPPEKRMGEFGHPAMFPEEIPYRLLRLFARRGDIVIDPFNGVGTTTLVAYRLSRLFVGIDISHQYCLTALSRIQQKSCQNRLFDCNEKGEFLPPIPMPQPKMLVWQDRGGNSIGEPDVS